MTLGYQSSNTRGGQGRISRPSRDLRVVMKVSRIGNIAVLALALGGCSVLSGVRPSADTYELAVPTIEGSRPVRRGTQVLIAEPQALKALDSQNILVQTDPLTIRYLDKSQWSDRLPRLVQMRLAQAFQNSDRFSGVGLPGQGLAIDYQIVTEIRSFGIEATSNSARVAIAVKILNDRNGAVASERVFDKTVPATGNDNASLVAAIDSAFDSVASEIVIWATGRL